MTFYSNPPQWALGYLRGRADAFRRGRLSLAYVQGAVRKALDLGATQSDIVSLLAPYGLKWDVDGQVLRQR